MDQFPAISSKHSPSVKGSLKFNKRIAAAVAGTALAASAVIVPQVSALEGYAVYNGQYGKIIQAYATTGTGANDVELKSVFLPNGVSVPPRCSVSSGNEDIAYKWGYNNNFYEATVIDEDGTNISALVPGPDCTEGTYTPPTTSEKPTPDPTPTTVTETATETATETETETTTETATTTTTETATSTVTVTLPTTVTEVVTPDPVTTTVNETEIVTKTSVETVTVTPSKGSSIGDFDSSIGGSSDDENSSSIGGAALLGLSALGALGLLSSGAASSASSDESAPVAGDDSQTDSEQPADGPVAGPDAKADAQKEQPATGPVGGADPKAAAQAQAVNVKNVPAGTQAAPQAAAPAQTAQQKQLANTGVQGTIVALAVGLIAAAAGAALLIFRRRA